MANITPPYRNTPKTIETAEHSQLLPSSYIVDQFTIVNSDLYERDLSPIVVSFTITEELFSPVNVLNIRIRDDLNFFEEMKLNGQELVKLKLTRSNPEYFDKKTSDKHTIELEFAVKEYPNYQKGVNTQTIQEYNIIAIPPYSYMSMLKRISRSVKGPITDSIKKILVNDLYCTESFEVKGNPVTPLNGVITTQSPLKAIEWMRSRLFDEKSSPFFFYRPISSEKFILHSWTNIATVDTTYRKFQYLPFLTNSSSTPLTYAESMSRILDIKSNIKLDKLEQAVGGAYSSTLRVVDIGSKGFSDKVFDVFKDTSISQNRMKPYDAYTDAVAFLKTSTSLSIGRSLKDFNRAFVKELAVNSAKDSISDPDSLSVGTLLQHLAPSQSYLSKLNARCHEVEVNGDFLLNPGVKVDIEVAKGAHTVVYDLKDNANQIDKFMSGTYVIGVVAHVFKDGLYRCKMKVFNDV